jgi:RNA polymerase sporulation-specific sigma factor
MKAQEILLRKLDRKPTLEELSKETGLSINQVETALNVIAAFWLPLEEEDGLAIKEPSQSEDPYQSLLIEAALKQLTEDEAQIIILYYFYGQTDREIGRVLNKSEDATKMARRRALEKLRAIISGEGV